MAWPVAPSPDSAGEFGFDFLERLVDTKLNVNDELVADGMRCGKSNHYAAIA
jgi:hypothetical protein